MARRKAVVKAKPVANLARLKHYAQACVGSRVEIRSANGDFRRMRDGESREILDMYAKNELLWKIHIAVFKLNQKGQIISMVSVGYRVESGVRQDDLTDLISDACWDLREEEGDQDLLTGWFASTDESITEIDDRTAMNAYADLHGYHG